MTAVVVVGRGREKRGGKNTHTHPVSLLPLFSSSWLWFKLEKLGGAMGPFFLNPHFDYPRLWRHRSGGEWLGYFFFVIEILNQMILIRKLNYYFPFPPPHTHKIDSRFGPKLKGNKSPAATTTRRRRGGGVLEIIWRCFDDVIWTRIRSSVSPLLSGFSPSFPKGNVYRDKCLKSHPFYVVFFGHFLLQFVSSWIFRQSPWRPLYVVWPKR